MDQGAWRALVHSVARSWTQVKQLSMHAYMCMCLCVCVCVCVCVYIYIYIYIYINYTYVRFEVGERVKNN